MLQERTRKTSPVKNTLEKMRGEKYIICDKTPKFTTRLVNQYIRLQHSCMFVCSGCDNLVYFYVKHS